MDIDDLRKARNEWVIRYSEKFEEFNEAALNDATFDTFNELLQDLNIAYEALKHIDRLIDELN